MARKKKKEQTTEHEASAPSSTATTVSPRPIPENWEPPREQAPSVLRTDEPLAARVIGLFGLSATMLGGVAVLVAVFGRISRLISPDLGAGFLILGLAGMLFHAVRDADVQFRRAYAALGYVLLMVATLVSFVPAKNAASTMMATAEGARGDMGAYFLPIGLPLAILGLLFLLAYLRHEDSPAWYQRTAIVFFLAGIIAGGLGLVGGTTSESFLLPRGLAASLLGLAFLASFVGVHGADSDVGQRAGVSIGLLGGATFAIAFFRALLMPLFYQWHWTATRPAPYLIPAGFLLMSVGLLYVLVAVFLCSDRPFVVMTRRELMTYFYSPIAYLVILGFGVIIWALYFFFVLKLMGRGAMGQSVPEPIITQYLLDWPPVICLILGIPLLTMRLMSEEWSSGTYEMMMTVPIKESTVVLSKFCAVFLFFLLLWLPFGFFLIALRAFGGLPFEYRQLFSFGIAIACMGAGFLSMGLFFSSLTRNQIIAGVITTAGMMFLTCIWLLKFGLLAFGVGEESAWMKVINHVSYIDVWIETLAHGVFVPSHMIFYLSLAVFWLFATVKVLEARKWS